MAATVSMSFIRIFFLFIFLSLPVSLSAKGLKFSDFGATIDLGKSRKLYEVRLFEGDGEKLILLQPLYGIKRKKINLIFRWKEKRLYTVSLITEKGKVLNFKEFSPSSRLKDIKISFSIPFLYSLFLKKEISTFVPSGSYVLGGLYIESLSKTPKKVFCEICLPKGVRFLTFYEKVKRGARKITFSKVLDKEGDFLFLPFCVMVRGDAKKIIKAEIRFNKEKFSKALVLVPKKASEISDLFEIKRFYFPANVDGSEDMRKRKDTVVIDSFLVRGLKRIFKLDEGYVSCYSPYGYEKVVIKNRSNHFLNLILKMQILNRYGDTPPFFWPPREFSFGRTEKSVVSFLTIPPNGEEFALLPLYVVKRPSAGKYEKIIDIYLFGTNDCIKRIKSPLYVVSGGSFPGIFTIFAILLTFASIIFLFIISKDLTKRFSLFEFVTISLFGALFVCLINFPTRIFGSFIYGLFGPFSFMITGLFSELLYFSLLFSLVSVIPKFGVILFVSVVRYILGSLFLGGFQLVDLFFLGAAIPIKETLFYLCGITRGKKIDIFRISLFILLLVPANLIMTAINFSLQMVFFRLFFANWYIILSFLINGFIYSSTGAFFGWNFGKRLVFERD